MKKNQCIREFADIKLINTSKKQIEDSEKSLWQLSNALALAGNEVRLKILYLLHQGKKLCVCSQRILKRENSNQYLAFLERSNP